MNLWKLTHNKYLKARLTIIFALSALLILYHVSKIYSVYWGLDAANAMTLTHVQTGIRLIIVISLAYVLLGYKKALWGMWFGIATLTATRYMLLWDTEPTADIEFSVYLSYLRGFISPIIITLLYPSAKR